MEKFIYLILQILCNEIESRAKQVYNLIETINNYDHNSLELELSDILVELSFDLEYYVENPEWRIEDPSYFGDEKLEKLLKEALEKIEILFKKKE